MFEDQILRQFVDEAFAVFDKNRTGFLDPNELANFYNQMFAMLNDPRRYNQQQAIQVFRSLDTNYDGKISKIELFNSLKYVLSQPAQPQSCNGGYNQGGYGQGSYGQGSYGQGNNGQGGYGQPYYNQQMNNQQQQGNYGPQQGYNNYSNQGQNFNNSGGYGQNGYGQQGQNQYGGNGGNYPYYK